jgi:hypothetical protein
MAEITRLENLGVKLVDGHFFCKDPIRLESLYCETTTDSLRARTYSLERGQSLDSHLVVRFSHSPYHTEEVLRKWHPVHYYSYTH